MFTDPAQSFRRYYCFGDSIRARCVDALRDEYLRGPAPTAPEHRETLARLIRGSVDSPIE